MGEGIRADEAAFISVGGSTDEEPGEESGGRLGLLRDLGEQAEGPRVMGQARAQSVRGRAVRLDQVRGGVAECGQAALHQEEVGGREAGCVEGDGRGRGAGEVVQRGGAGVVEEQERVVG